MLNQKSSVLRMQVEVTHHIDASEQGADGMYDWYYEYDLYRFTDGDKSLVARSYEDSKDEAHFLHLEVHANPSGVLAKHLTDPLLKQAAQYLRGIGKLSIKYLGPEGYASLPAEA